ncbi:uncharacterized protein A4U43_C07F8160 [Asparagus officinalis]|uniref:Uncharacterized protein n=1 Tax=Asparagus officinalis TaxID=4686 RepID=A0A5P1EDC1_ASPOF|nr:transcription factor MYB56-like [Asparagus officinalis]ONK62789.1 uncharacterized protein A4U43_C07F8160 [Asparagus officinalis]
MGFFLQGESSSGQRYEMGLLMRDEGEGQNGNNEEKMKREYSKFCARGHWRPAEDAKLIELVAQHGPQNWNLIAQSLEGRSGKSCRLRWFNQLNPRIRKHPFTQEEEERLLAAQRAFGNKWALIARLFPGRTDNAVKNHWHVIMSKEHRSQRRRSKHCIKSSVSNPPPLIHCLFPNNAGVINGINYNEFSGESSNSNRYESVSTCTDLSLNSTSRAGFGLIKSYSSQLQQHGFADKCARSTGWYGDALRLVSGVDQSGYSDSHSEASAAESVVSNMSNNGAVNGDREHESEKIGFPFFDFLGVGAM